MAFPFQIYTRTIRRLRINAKAPLLDENQERAGGARGSAWEKQDWETAGANLTGATTVTAIDAWIGTITGEGGSGARSALSEQNSQCGARRFCSGCGPLPSAATHFIPVDEHTSISEPLPARASSGHSTLSAMASMASQEPSRRVDSFRSIGLDFYHEGHGRRKATTGFAGPGYNPFSQPAPGLAACGCLRRSFPRACRASRPDAGAPLHRRRR